MAAPLALLCGHLTCDRYGDQLLPGGSVYYAGQAFRALGARVRIATAAATDYPSRPALDGLEVAVQPSPRTTIFSNVYDASGRRRQSVDAVAERLAPASLPAAWRFADLLHLAPVLGELDIAAWVSAVRARFVGIGVQGWVRQRQPDGSVAQPPWRFDRAHLAGVNAACVGEDDLRGQGDLLDRLVDAVPVVAFTHSERGCDIIVRGRTTKVGVYRTQQVDPTGAGDVFSAGFFLAMAGGADPVDSARLGAAAASIVVEGRGGETLDRVGEAHARALQVEREPGRERSAG